MELAKKHDNMPTQSWTSRANRENNRNTEYYSELRTWLQHAILQAEKSKNNNKKDKLLTLLREL